MPVAYYSQPLRVDLVRVCFPLKPREIYLRWISRAGNWEGWLFSGELDVKTDLVNPTSYAPGDGRRTVALRRSGRDVLTVRAGDLSDNDAAGLSTLLDSPTVYKQNVDGTLEPVFVAENATAARASDETKHVLGLDVELRRRNSLTN